MRTLKEYRAIARLKLAGNYGTVIGAGVLYSLFMNLVSTPAGSFGTSGNLQDFLVSGKGSSLTLILLSIPFTILSMLLAFLFNPGLEKIPRDLVRDEKTGIGELFYSFTHNPITAVSIGLWEMLFSLPAIIIFVAGAAVFTYSDRLFPESLSLAVGAGIFTASFVVFIIWMAFLKLSLSMVYFLYFEDPEESARALIKKSFDLMNGKKGQLLSLYLSYAGYYILGILSCGLALLWVQPNITGATALFYEDIKNEPSFSGGTVVTPVRGTYDGYHQDYWN